MSLCTRDYTSVYSGLFCTNSLVVLNSKPSLYRWVWTSDNNSANFFFHLHYTDTNIGLEPSRLSPTLDVREPRKFTNKKGTFFDVFPNIPSQGEELPTNIVWQVEPGVPYGIAFCRLPSYANRDVDNEWTLTGTNPQTETLLKNALSSESAYKTSQGLPLNQTREDCGRYSIVTLEPKHKGLITTGIGLDVEGTIDYGDVDRTGDALTVKLVRMRRLPENQDILLVDRMLKSVTMHWNFQDGPMLRGAIHLHDLRDAELPIPSPF